MPLSGSTHIFIHPLKDTLCIIKSISQRGKISSVSYRLSETSPWSFCPSEIEFHFELHAAVKGWLNLLVP